MTKTTITATIISYEEPLTLDELAHAIHADRTIIIEMVEHDILQPRGHAKTDWRFDETALRRARVAANFYRDLEVNWQGAALALQLLEDIQALEDELRSRP